MKTRSLAGLVLIAALGVGGYWLTRDRFRPGLEPVLIEDSTEIDSAVMRLLGEKRLSPTP